MSKQNKFPDNVIPVNFKRKNSDKPTLKTLYPDAFAMFVDSDSDNPDLFSQAVLDAVKEQEALLSDMDQDDQIDPSQGDRDETLE